MTNYVQRKSLPVCLKEMSKKQKASVAFQASDEMELHGTHWDGGSRSIYTLVNLKTGVKNQIQGTLSPFTKQLTTQIPLGWVMVTTGVFCGKPATMHITVAVGAPFDYNTPVGIVADWLEEQDHGEEAALLRLSVSAAMA